MYKRGYNLDNSSFKPTSDWLQVAVVGTALAMLGIDTQGNNWKAQHQRAWRLETDKHPYQHRSQLGSLPNLIGCTWLSTFPHLRLVKKHIIASFWMHNCIIISMFHNHIHILTHGRPLSLLVQLIVSSRFDVQLASSHVAHVAQGPPRTPQKEDVTNLTPCGQCVNLGVSESGWYP